jgi:hypothetical protein
MLRLISAIACLTVFADPANAAQTFQCTTRDVVTVENGAFVRNSTARQFGDTYKTIVVDTRSGAIKFGVLETKDWIILQAKVDGDWDFVATSADTRNVRVIADTIRLRVPRGGDSEPVQFLYIYGGSWMLTGTCEALY